ncbi:ATPase family associated with various cellular activities (AAA) [Novymonas esmeraldas]|uniref:ATPase family associated with various cellular activities (AAA) n=1 Tax=Novymonas esmeraldas TaxID=1808958 RepID=A0AAW0EUA2_9TRYP
MSTLSYQQQYQQVLADLTEVQREDAHVSGLRVADDAKAQQTYYTQYWISLYVRYVRLARQLSTIHDTELQPQRRRDVRTLLDSCLGRMLEARHNIVEHCGDYVALDDTLEEMKVSPAELDPPLPTYLLEDRRETLLQERAYVLSLQQHYRDTEPEVAPVALAVAAHSAALFAHDPTRALPPLTPAADKAPDAATAAAAAPSDSKPPAMPTEEAVRVLQLAERGRQARQRAKIQMLLFRQQQYAAAHGAELRSLTGRDRAATIVQKVALSYIQQKRARARYQQEHELLGMASTAAIRSDAARVAAGVHHDDRKARQRVNEAELMQKTREMERQLRSLEGPKTLEVMLDEVLMHMAYARLEGKAKDGVVEVPTAEDGGTLALLGRSTRKGGPAGAEAGGGRASFAATGRSASRASDGDAAATTTSAQGGGGGGARRPSSRRGGGGGGDGAAGDGAAAAAPTPAAPPSAVLDHVSTMTERHNTLWREHFQRTRIERGDLDQPYDDALLRRELMDGARGVMQELRQCVDQLVEMEVNNLKSRVEAARNAGKKKKKGGRKGKRAKAPKKPKLRDPMKGEDLESYLNTTVYENKLQLPPMEVRLASFVGPVGISAGPLDRLLRAQTVDKEVERKWQRVLRGWGEEVERTLGMSKDKMEALFNAYAQQASWLRDPSAAEVRSAAADYAVLPLGSQVVHDLAPHPTGLLLYGAAGSGKTMLAYAIANESGARFFNLSPGNFLTTKGIAKMVQVVFYTARTRGPSIIYMDCIEKVFPGKGGKGKKGKKDAEMARGKKLKKEVLKGIASLQPTDRVLVVATSTEPWCADVAALCKVVQRAVHLAPPDFATREVLLRTFITARLAEVQAAALTPAAEGLVADAVRHLALLTDGLSAGQLRECVATTLTAYRLERVARHPITAEEFVPALAVTAGQSAADTQRFHTFQASLPIALRRANVAEDFQPAEEEAKRR